MIGDPLRPKPPAGHTLYREPRFELRVCERPLRGGGQVQRGLIVHPGSVALVPIARDGQLILIRNHRWAVGQPLLELPAGTLGHDERPEIGAARELQEETGFSAGHLEPLHAFYASPGLSTEIVHVFIARDLTEVGQRLEPDEQIEVVRVPPDQAREALASGAIRDAKTIAGLGLFLHARGVRDPR